MYYFLKRLLDIIVSFSSLVLLFPLFLILVIILKFSDEGEIFYFQKRIGYKNKEFYIIKFATMLKNSENMGGGVITLKNDYRVTSIGKLLRSSKINELPQLINILKGDISLVGPRPVMPISFNSYPADIRKVIYNSKPGLTGIGSIVFRDEEDLMTKASDNGNDPWEYYKNTIYPFKGKLEIWYQKNCSFFLDLQLIFFTAWVILFPKSKIYEEWFKYLPKRNF
jgi:lipopolysaccharide/colanic/teichoic acid biosynthesis glycosyltransferase